MSLLGKFGRSIWWVGRATPPKKGLFLMGDIILKCKPKKEDSIFQATDQPKKKIMVKTADGTELECEAILEGKSTEE